MKNYCVNLSPKAQRDITEILDYIAFELNSPLAAINLNDKILEQFDRLSSFPFSGEIYDSEIPLKYIYRRIIVDNYLIFYTVNEEESMITIMHIVYGASNYINIL